MSIHYPGNLVKETHTTVRFSKEGLNFSHYFYKNIPEEVIYRDISATINNRSLSDFQVKFTGKFEYYRTAFTNMSNFESTDPNFIELLIYGAPGNTAFKFPDISQEGIISGFIPKDFKLVAMTLYDFDKPADKLNELNSNNGYTPADALEKIIVGVPVN